MNDTNPQLAENLAQTLARELPKAHIAHVEDTPEKGSIVHIAVPRGHDLKAIDNEAILDNPRRIKATAALNDTASFLGYVNRHAAPNSVVWCHFNPQTFALDFTAVFDEHDKWGGGINDIDRPGWRQHRATYKPDFSAEWKVWHGSNGSGHSKGQVAFAEFVENHTDDIAAAEGYPTSLDMHKMATEFESKQDMRLKSHVRLQSGDVQLEYINKDDDATLERMKVFDRFKIGIPVFWSGPAYRIEAKLRYRVREGAVTFWYELQRPDRVHEAAAKELIAEVKAGINVPLLMGSVTS